MLKQTNKKKTTFNMQKLHTRYIAEFVKIALGSPTNHTKHCFWKHQLKRFLAMSHSEALSLTN